MMKWHVVCVTGLLIALSFQCTQAQQQKWVTYQPNNGEYNGKYIVFISGDEEYRSEEALPMLAKILTVRHGFKTTVLFAIDPKTGNINPNYQHNIPGLKHLQEADLMVILTRFRALPEEQMKYIDAYLKAGKPVIGLRTATHAFRYPEDSESPYAKYSYNSSVEGWEGGFGHKILGETWVNHHGAHGEEGTRALINGILKDKGHPILKGVDDIWVPTDVYGIRDLTDAAEVLLWGLPTNGMTAEATLNWHKSMMPIAWTKYYKTESGNEGRVFTTTMGAATDLKNEDLRRLLVNACYWAVGLEEEISPQSSVEVVGEYNPTAFGFDGYQKGLTPLNFELKKEYND